jgi:hypothetical protein
MFRRVERDDRDVPRRIGGDGPGWKRQRQNHHREGQPHRTEPVAHQLMTSVSERGTRTAIAMRGGHPTDEYSLSEQQMCVNVHRMNLFILKTGLRGEFGCAMTRVVHDG